MEEVLYNVEIFKENGIYIGKTYSDIDGIKKFQNKEIEILLRDMANDIQFNLDETNNQFADFSVTE